MIGDGAAARSQRARMLAGEDYLADDPELRADSDRAQQITRRYNDSALEEADLRHSLLCELLGSIGEGVEIRPPFRCDYGYQLHVGARTFANFGLVVLDVAAVWIGADVQIGPHVQLLTATHPIEAERRRAKWESGRPITIGDNVWLGGGVIVCPGVRIGSNTVVGAGAVVVRDLAPNVVAAGNPARVIRPL
ncbi:MAG TPA: sugar O-acetyltransferase [Mycobacteriales bacterium]|jgi:maltose O-acetyltransferase|nr:sugar O-acetyltransferase [Mycobacteriales bacterium]